MDDVKPVHRYKAQTMFSFGGAKIEYFPHGPEVVLATEFDAQSLRADTAEAELAKLNDLHKALVQGGKLVAAEQRIAELSKLLKEASTDELFPIRQRLLVRIKAALNPKPQTLGGKS